MDTTKTLVTLENDPRLISKHTTRQYKADLFDFEAWRNGKPITKTLVVEYAAHLQADGKAPNTINQRLAAIRWYARKIADLAMDYSGDPEFSDFYAKQAARVVTVRDVKGSRPEKGRHIEQGELFTNINKGGRITGGRLSGEALRKMLDKRSEQAELSKPVTWHDFRRTFAGNLWDAKIDGVTIQKLMSHASQNQTAKYDRRPDAARQQAVKVLDVPYRSRQE